jgi:hypothetical protein
VISYIVATVGRESLQTTLESIECWDGDEIIIIGKVKTKDMGHVRCINCPPGNDWGSTERNIATKLARGRYLSHMDDDDVYAKGSRALFASAIIENPAKVTIFRMKLLSGSVLWQDPEIRHGNVGTPMILMPNDPAKMGTWGENQDCGDLRFLETMGWDRASEVAWRREVVAEIGQAHV